MEVEILSFRVTKQSNRKIALLLEMTDWNIQQENGFQKCASHSLQKNFLLRQIYIYYKKHETLSVIKFV